MRILVATPAYGAQVTEPYMQSVLRLIFAAPEAGHEIGVFTNSGESLITRARNGISAQFMASDWDALLFIDADIGFDPEDVWRLANSGHKLCAKPYPLKKINWEYLAGVDSSDPDILRAATTRSVVNFVPGAEVVNGFVPVLDAGTGFMFIMREVFEKMRAEMPSIEYISDQLGTQGEKHWAFFDTAIREGRYLSEDYEFCRRWQDLGGEVMVDLAGRSLRHHGNYTYGG